MLFYICACCDTRCFKNVCLFLFVEVKALLGLIMLHVVQYSTQNKTSMSMTRMSFLGLQETFIGPLMFLLYVNVIGDNFSPQTSVSSLRMTAFFTRPGHQEYLRWGAAPTGFIYHGWVVQYLVNEVLELHFLDSTAHGVLIVKYNVLTSFRRLLPVMRTPRAELK